MEREAKISSILQQFSGLKHISQVKTKRRKSLMYGMKGNDEELVTDRQGIANIFADFYSQLYQSRQCKHSEETTTTTSELTIQPFTDEELITAIKSLKNRRCKDQSGMIAEMIKNGGKKFRQVLLDLYNEVTKSNACLPQQWKSTVIKVIFKSGDPQLPQNYRPISIIPLLYKLLSRLLYNRLSPQLDAQQSVDQAGFRRNYCTEDHLHVMALVQEQAAEWQCPG